ncbi:WXG100 family type VII secretion target [Gordonia amicalis]|uniref:WXG100 family type VII secretion target n=1 Tax=Gordonia amicalis TaxID=89053 RepID=UPI0022A7C004|nr:WXG100 family type VII secretion target [Gordonia amicalis]MCZ0911107.1 WXG100 family type VII secretion target [Gordonia amicalis]
MSTDRVEVDPEVLWSAARTISMTADLSGAQLRNVDATLAGCGAGWATRASSGFDEFVDRAERFTRALSQKLGDIEQTSRAAAAAYERADHESGRRIAGPGRPGPHLNL